jgi:hypothetical protein
VTVSLLPKEKGEVCGLKNKLTTRCTGVQVPQLLDVLFRFSVIDISSVKGDSHKGIYKKNSMV